MESRRLTTKTFLMSKTSSNQCNRPPKIETKMSAATGLLDEGLLPRSQLNNKAPPDGRCWARLQACNQNQNGRLQGRIQKNRPNTSTVEILAKVARDSTKYKQTGMLGKPSKLQPRMPKKVSTKDIGIKWPPLLETDLGVTQVPIADCFMTQEH